MGERHLKGGRMKKPLSNSATSIVEYEMGKDFVLQVHTQETPLLFLRSFTLKVGGISVLTMLDSDMHELFNLICTMYSVPEEAKDGAD